MKQRVIYDNYSLYDMEDDVKEFLMEEYPELCTVEVEDAKTHEIHYEPTDEQIWNRIYEDDRWEWDDIFSQLKSFFKNKTLVMAGTVGLWHGRYSGGEIGEFEDLFYDITKDCDYWKFTDSNGHLNLECTHHDGTHYVEFRILTDAGNKFSDNWNYSYNKRYNFSEGALCEKLASNSHYSLRPNFCKTVWG